MQAINGQNGMQYTKCVLVTGGKSLNKNIKELSGMYLLLLL